MTPRTVQFDPMGHLQWAEKIAEPSITMGTRETATMVAVSRVNALMLIDPDDRCGWIPCCV